MYRSAVYEGISRELPACPNAAFGQGMLQVHRAEVRKKLSERAKSLMLLAVFQNVSSFNSALLMGPTGPSNHICSSAVFSVASTRLRPISSGDHACRCSMLSSSEGRSAASKSFQGDGPSVVRKTLVTPRGPKAVQAIGDAPECAEHLPSMSPRSNCPGLHGVDSAAYGPHEPLPPEALNNTHKTRLVTDLCRTVIDGSRDTHS